MGCKSSQEEEFLLHCSGQALFLREDVFTPKKIKLEAGGSMNNPLNFRKGADFIGFFA